MLSSYGRNEWLTIMVVGVGSAILFAVGGWWLACLVAVVATVALLSFFRDPQRSIPSQRGAVVAPADGRISSIHQLDVFS